LQQSLDKPVEWAVVICSSVCHRMRLLVLSTRYSACSCLLVFCFKKCFHCQTASKVLGWGSPFARAPRRFVLSQLTPDDGCRIFWTEW